MAENLIEGIQRQCNRCRDLVTVYEEIPTGAFGKAAIQACIDEGEASIASGDAVRMLRAFKRLEGCE